MMDALQQYQEMVANGNPPTKVKMNEATWLALKMLSNSYGQFMGKTKVTQDSYMGLKVEIDPAIAYGKFEFESPTSKTDRQ